MDVRVGMPAVYESLAPRPGSEFSPVQCRTLEVEARDQGQGRRAIRSEQKHRLDDPRFRQRSPAGHGVSAKERRDRLARQVDPWGPLGVGRNRPGREGEPQDEGRGAGQSDSATAPAPAASPARMKSRFIRVIVSMLISLGHASWHSP